MQTHSLFPFTLFQWAVCCKNNCYSVCIYLFLFIYSIVFVSFLIEIFNLCIQGCYYFVKHFAAVIWESCINTECYYYVFVFNLVVKLRASLRVFVYIIKFRFIYIVLNQNNIQGLKCVLYVLIQSMLKAFDIFHDT